METIIVTTDFSDSSANALNYACAFAKEYNLGILLVHIYSIPTGYAAEGLSLVTINDALDADRERLRGELERAAGNYPQIEIAARMIVADFLESLQELNRELKPGMIVMGALTEYSELWQWGNDWLNALLSLPCPVLIIPRHIVYTPIINIAFACDKNVCLPEQINKMKKLVQLTKANFYVVHVTRGKFSGAGKTVAAFTETFGDINPQFQTIENKPVIIGVAEFEQQYNIDLLLVIPRRHGIWHSLFNKSYSRQLALLNNLPVMAIH